MRDRLCWPGALAFVVQPLCAGPLCSQAVDSIVGTYAFTICSQPCDTLSDSSARVRGELVLLPEAIPMSAFAAAPDPHLQLDYYQIRQIYGRDPNACFSAEAVGTGPRSYASFESFGVTRWVRSEENEVVYFGMLWSGVDIHYRVRIEEGGGRVIRGHGYPSSAGTASEDSPEFFLGRRIGSAEVHTCVKAQRTEGRPGGGG